MLAIRTILHPTDFSERSEFAFRLACALAHDYGARLLVLHVVEIAPAVSGEGVLVLPPPIAYDDLREKLYRLRSEHPKLRIEGVLTEGDPATEILGAANENKADVIVLGTHGRTGLSRLLMGSVAEEVVRKASCPVVTVKTRRPMEQRLEQPDVGSTRQTAETAKT